MTHDNLEHRLSPPVPPPPEELVQSIIDDIPDELVAHPGIVQNGHRDTNRRRRHWHLAAAAVVTVALTGAVMWQLRHERPIVITNPQTGGTVAEQPKVEENTETRLDTARQTAPPELQHISGPPAEVPGETDQDGSASRPDASKTDSESYAKEERARIRNETLGVLTEGTGQASASKPVDRRQSAQAVGETEAATSSRRTERVPIPDPEPRFLRDPGSTERTDPPPDRGRVLASPEAPAPSEPDKRGVVTGQVVTAYAPSVDVTSGSAPQVPPPSTGGTAEPNDQPYGDVFFEPTGVNPFVDTEDDPLSTFGLDVDTGSYTVARRYLRDGHLPPHAAIRVEEFVNYFDYDDPAPRRDDFSLTAEGAHSVFADGERYYTLRFGIRAREVSADQRPPALLVFCIDVSGSMRRENRLVLVKRALFELLDQLRSDDRVGLVVYGSAGRVVLEPTSDLETIGDAVDRLRSGGSTNAEEGLVLAYEMAERRRREESDEIVRVILCSDGVANVGRTGPDSILERIRSSVDNNIEMTSVGFGMGNYNDTLMERLADAGNGRYAYVDNLDEARRIFVSELTGTLLTLGHDARAQVAFNAEVVSRWRLLGYENRDIADDRFRDPAVDAGEIGAGHRVTAVYEVKLRPDTKRRQGVATLRYRYRPRGTSRFVEQDQELRVRDLSRSWERATPSLQLASLVAEFAEILKGSSWARESDLTDVLRRIRRLENGHRGDPQVAELAELVERAARLRHTSNEPRSFTRD